MRWTPNGTACLGSRTMILDASVLAKWFLPDEALVEQALAVRDAALRDEVDLAAPPVLWAETSHALVRAHRRGRIISSDAQALAERMEATRSLITIVDIPLNASVRIALRVGVSAYDAQYLACSLRMQRTVLTADRGMLERGVAAGFDVAWLGDAPTS